MQISVENTGALERKVSVAVPAKRITAEVSDRLQKLTKTTKIQGFRPGKVPLKVVQGRYGEQVRKEVVGELIQSSLYEAINQEQLRPAGPPQIAGLKDELGEDLAYTATFEIYPEVTLKPLDEMTFEKKICAVSDDDITSMIDVLRKQRRTLKIVERPAQLGDVVNINFDGFVDGEAFAGGKAENHELELGSKRFLAGFEEGLIGTSAGDETTLKLKFPEDYNTASLRGKEAEFKVKVNGVNETVLPVVDAAFMLEFDVKDGKEETLRHEIKRNMAREVELALGRQNKHEVLDAIYAANEIELPQTLVTNAAHQAKHDFEENLKRQGLDAKTIDALDASAFDAQAKKRVALQLILADIIKNNKLKADPAKVRDMVEQIASGYEDSAAVLQWYYSDQKKLAEIEAVVLEDVVVDWALAHANVTEKVCTFDEIMNKGQTAS